MSVRLSVCPLTRHVSKRLDGSLWNLASGLIRPQGQNRFFFSRCDLHSQRSRSHHWKGGKLERDKIGTTFVRMTLTPTVSWRSKVSHEYSSEVMISRDRKQWKKANKCQKIRYTRGITWKTPILTPFWGIFDHFCTKSSLVSPIPSRWWLRETPPSERTGTDRVILKKLNPFRCNIHGFLPAERIAVNNAFNAFKYASSISQELLVLEG